MNDKKNTKKTKTALPEEDLQLYRLFCIFGVAIIGFAAFRLIPYESFFGMLKYGRWVTLALLILTVGGLCYVSFFWKPDESKNLVTAKGAAYFLIPVLYLLTTYRMMDNPSFKCQVAFGFVALFAAIYNIYKREFRWISAVAFLSLIALYYASHRFYNTYETVIGGISKALIFLIPAVIIAAVLLRDRVKFPVTLAHDRVGAGLILTMCGVLLVLALVTLLVPSIFLYAMITILAVYVVIGIVCTIRLI